VCRSYRFNASTGLEIQLITTVGVLVVCVKDRLVGAGMDIVEYTTWERMGQTAQSHIRLTRNLAAVSKKTRSRYKRVKKESRSCDAQTKDIVPRVQLVGDCEDGGREPID